MALCRQDLGDVSGPAVALRPLLREVRPGQSDLDHGQQVRPAPAPRPRPARPDGSRKELLDQDGLAVGHGRLLRRRPRHARLRRASPPSRHHAELVQAARHARVRHEDSGDRRRDRHALGRPRQHPVLRRNEAAAARHRVRRLLLGRRFGEHHSKDQPRLHRHDGGCARHRTTRHPGVPVSPRPRRPSLSKSLLHGSRREEASLGRSRRLRPFL